MIKLFNTLGRKKELFQPLKGKQVGFYSCGPTVYDYAHIGNLRTYIFEDILGRVLQFNGYKVKQIMNITDVDDKTIRRANQEKMSLSELTNKYREAFLTDIKKLNIQAADQYPKATAHISAMQELIQKLLDKGAAYLSKDGSIYFSIEKFKDYGRFAHLDLKGLKSKARVYADEYQKEEGGDFVLWKAWSKNDGDNFWQPEFNIAGKKIKLKGRPGWHIECSAMSRAYLGQPFDIHAGAVDLIFPHHQNEIAQSEAAFGKKMVNYWIHGEHLLVEKKKMAKSAGNFYTLQDIIKKGFQPLAFRYLCLETHYRSKMNFTWRALKAAQNTLNSIRELGQRQRDRETERQRNRETEKQRDRETEKQRDRETEKQMIVESFNNDLDTPKALSLLHQANDYNLWLEFEPILGLDLSSETYHPTPNQRQLIQDREEARKKKDFKRADRIRQKLEKEGIKIEDTSEGPKAVSKY